MTQAPRHAASGSSISRRVLTWMREGTLVLAALVGVATFVVIAVCTVLQIRPLVFMSGSMSPAIDAGALAFAQRAPIDELKRGDIVSVVTDDGPRVTHRIVAIDRTGAAPALRLKGDANPVEDRDPYVVPSADRVLFALPHVGRGVAFISSPQGLFFLGVGVTGLLVYAFRPGLRRRGTRVLAFGVLPLVVIVGSPTHDTSTFALFTDTGTIRSQTQTHQVQTQAQPGCQNVDSVPSLGNIARITWSQVDARYEYAWELRRASNNNLESSGTIGSGVAQGSTVTLDISPGLASANVSYNVIVRARLINATSWTAATTTSTPVRRVGGNPPAFRCGA